MAPGTIAALVPVERKQCRDRWHDIFEPSIDRATVRVNDVKTKTKLKELVQAKTVARIAAIAALVPGRTKTVLQEMA
jgi:hypothetical protein